MSTLGECRTRVFADKTVVAEFHSCSGGPENTGIGQDPRNEHGADSHVTQRVIKKT